MKILNKLTLKNLKLNKTRAVVTIIGIMLSTALIMSVAGLVSSAHQTIIAEKMSYTGNFEILLEGTNTEYIDKIISNRDIEEVYVQSEMGCAIAPNSKSKNRPYINIVGLSKNSFENGFEIPLKEGRFPENENEIILTPEAVLNYNPDIKVGDKITLDLGTRVATNGKTLSDFDEYSSFIYNEYDEDDNLTLSVTEKLENAQKKTFTVTGIMSDCDNSYLLAESWEASSTAITLLNDYSKVGKINAYVNIKPEAEKDGYIKVTEQVIGISEKQAEMAWDIDPYSNKFSKAEYEELMKTIENNENYSYFGFNYEVMESKGYLSDTSAVHMFYIITLFVVSIIVFASAFIIRNSFAISTTEKTKLYGMLISAGATPKQVMKNVLFEGVVLGVIGTALGLILGTGVMALLVGVLNVLLADVLNGATVVFSLPWWLPLFTILMSAIVIFFSTYASADRASKIAPVVAIRENNDVKLSKKQKNYKAPKYIKKLFGQGGVIAYKNLKRSKKKYRTTVISIVVSVAVFITISSFVDYEKALSSEYFTVSEYNLEVDYTNDEQTEVIKSLDGVNDVVEMKKNSSTLISGYKGYSKEYKEFLGEFSVDTYVTSGAITTVLKDDYFKEFAEDHGFNYEQVKDKILVYNCFTRVVDGKEKNGRCYNIPENAKVEISFAPFDYTPEPHYSQTFETYVGGEIINLDKKYKDALDIYLGEIIVSESWYKKNAAAYEDYFVNKLSINCEEPEDIQRTIGELGYYDLTIFNKEEDVESYNSMSLIVSMFSYGFITIISLIGITNIFNTITTNMKLRRKEFAILRSVGMTDKEFNRMVRLETLLYGAKALAIGLPLGIAGSLFAHYNFNQINDFAYMFPWIPVLLSILCVFALLWFVMKYSLNKIKKQNIIETIRNDNI